MGFLSAEFVNGFHQLLRPERLSEKIAQLLRTLFEMIMMPRGQGRWPLLSQIIIVHCHSPRKRDIHYICQPDLGVPVTTETAYQIGVGWAHGSTTRLQCIEVDLL